MYRTKLPSLNFRFCRLSHRSFGFLPARFQVSQPRAIMAQQQFHEAYTRPTEAGPHQIIVLSWPSAGAAYVDQFQGMRAEVHATISAVAAAVARFEPVMLLVDHEHLDEAHRRFPSNGSSQYAHAVQVRTVKTGCPDMWMRDIAPTFTVSADGVLHGIDFNFNGWGCKVGSEASSKLAKSLLDAMDIPRISTSIVTEGGALEIDGQGTLIASESSIINNNRNRGKTRVQVEAELSRVLNIEKFLWVPGAKDLDSTDFHIDAVARFARPGILLFASPRDISTNSSKQDAEWIAAHDEARRILDNVTDARGRAFEIIDMVEPRLEKVIANEAAREELLASKETTVGYRPVFSYVNYLLVAGGVVFPQFGDREADEAALETARKVFPEREIVPVNARALGVFGGGIHCISQEVPLV